MQSQDNASAARTCLILSIVAMVLVLIVCVVVSIGFVLNLGDDDGPPADQRGTIVADATVPPLIFSVIDVGQGTCVVVITPDGRTLVADSGRSQGRVREVVIPYLREHGVERIDYLVATNPDQDHIGGMPAILEAMEVGAWVDPVVGTTNQTYAESLEMVAELGIEPIRARRGGTLDLGPNVTAEILWPVDPLIMDGSVESRNDNSIVIRITHGDIAFLITGDAEERAEEAMVEADDDLLRADVMVVAHHGSNSSSTAEFLDAVSPTVAIIPVGLDNQYGHPRDEVIQRLRFRSIRIYRTDLDGTVEVRSNGEAYQVQVLGTENGS